MVAYLQLIPPDTEDEDRLRQDLLERFLRARTVSSGQRTTHRAPFNSVQANVLLEVAGPRRPWNESCLLRAWRHVLAVEPHGSALGAAAIRARVRRRWPDRLLNPALHKALMRLRMRACEEGTRFPEFFDPVARALLDYALLALLTAKP